MSTVDPSIVRKERAARRPSDGRIIALLVGFCLSGLLSAFGWLGMMAMIAAEAEEPSPALLAIPAGMLGLIALSFPWFAAMSRRGDIGVLYPLAAILIGAGAGAVLAGHMLFADPTLLFILGALSVVLGAAAIIGGRMAALSRTRESGRVDELMRTGTVTTATVTDRGYTAFDESSAIITQVTFTFTDVHGTQRWVQKRMKVSAEDPFVEGRRTRLWYDHAHPDDLSAIVVELAQQNALRPRN